MFWALTEAAPGAILLADRSDPLWQAPRYRDVVSGLPEPQLSYSEMLLRHGYLSAASLTPLLLGWRELIEKADPHLVITDHAPTALPAAQPESARARASATAFSARRRCSPSLPWCPGWRHRIAARRAGNSCRPRAAESINGAPWARWAPNRSPQVCPDALRADEDIVTTWRNLTPIRSPTPRWGALLSTAGGAAPECAGAHGVRVFAYLKAYQPQTLPLLRALRRKRCAVLAYCR